MPEKKNTYLTLHKNFVRTDIEYTDRVTGEKRTFNSVTLPKGTVIDGVDVSYYQFSPMFVNDSRYRGEDYRDIPLLSDREVWLKKSVLDENGQPVLDEHGKPAKDVVRVMPAQIKEALDRSRSEYLQSLAEKARGARESSERAAERLASSARRHPAASPSRSSSSAVRRSRSFTVADMAPSFSSSAAISPSRAGIAPRRLYLRLRCHSRSCASASDQLAPSSSPVETTETMRFSSSAEPLIALSPWPMKALRRNTSRVAPVSASPAEAPSSPGTRSSVPV